MAKDVLILDEPEIHLHPQWQVLYAEIVVLLQKAFDLTVVVTTHSYFFCCDRCIFKEIWANERHKILFVEYEQGNAAFEDVSDNTEKIYRLMAEASEAS